MPDSRPITGVTADETSAFGVQHVANQYPSLVPAGISSGWTGARTLVYYQGANGAAVVFEFTQAYTNPSPYAQFHFDTNRAISAGNYASSQFGLTNVRNAAQAVYPVGISAAKFGIVRVHRTADTAFAFTDAYTPITPYNTPFYFGGQLVVTAVGAIDAAIFGNIEEVKKPLQALLNETPYVGGAGKPRVGRYPDTNFFFTQAYTNPSPFAQFHFDTNRAISAGAYFATQFGLTGVRNAAQAAYPVGISSALTAGLRTRFTLGQPLTVDFYFDFTDNTPSSLNVPFYFSGQLNPRPVGIDSLRMGLHKITAKAIEVTGLDSSEYGTQYLWEEWYVRPPSMQLDEYGLPHDADFENRSRYFAGIDANAIGTYRVTADPQYIVLPSQDTSTALGQFVPGFNRFYALGGYEFTGFEKPTIEFLRHTPSGIDSFEGSNTTVRLNNTVVKFVGTFAEPLTEFGGQTRIWNLLTFVTLPTVGNATNPGDSAVSDYGYPKLSGPPYPNSIGNLLRDGYGRPTLRLGAKALAPSGIDSLAMPRPYVAYWLQYINGLTGFDSFRTTQNYGHVIGNTSKSFTPGNLDSFLPGLHAYSNPPQFVFNLVSQSALGIGEHLVAYFERTVKHKPWRYEQIGQPIQPTVWSNKIVFDGLDATTWGAWKYRVFFNIIQPDPNASWVAYGWHAVENVNRARAVPSLYSLEMGWPAVRDNKLFAGGFFDPYIGKHAIRDQTTRITQWAAWITTGYGYHAARYDPPIPDAQAYKLNGIGPVDLVGSPVVSPYYLYPVGISSQSIGDHSVRDNILRPRGIDSMDGFPPDPILVFDKVIKPRSIYTSEDPENPGLYGVPHMWPHYIYPPDPQHPMDHAVWQKYGEHYVDYYHRALDVHSDGEYDRLTTEYGTQKVEARDRRLSVTGLKRDRYGWIIIPFVPQTWEVPVSGVSAEYGQQGVGYPPPVWSPYLAPSGIDGFSETDPMVDYFHRFLRPVGIDSLATTIMPGPWYTPRWLTRDSGLDSFEYGEDTFIDFSTRYRTVGGLDSFTCRPSPKKQMRVTKDPSGTAPVHALR